MIVASLTRSHTRLLAGMTVVGIGLLLTGCDFEPHDSISKPPSSMPVPASVQAEQAKAAQQGHSALAVPTEQEMGMPVYPNSTIYVDATGLAIKPDLSVDTSTATLATADPLDKVVNFYKQGLVQTDGLGKTSPASAREENQNGKKSTIISGNDRDGNVMIAIIHENNKQTVMELMHTHMRAIPSSVSGASDRSPGSASTSGSPTGGAPSTTGTTSTPTDSGTRPNFASPGASGASGSNPTTSGTSTPTSRTP